MKYSPAKVILYFFVIVILAGTGLLSLPWSRTDPHALSLLSNMFISTSAVCVTGLTVVDIGKYYTLFGQVIILLLIQIGGLGYMTMSTVIAMLLGKVALKERVVIKEILDVNSFAGLLTLMKKIMIIVFLIEGFGAAILTLCFSKSYPFIEAMYLGIFNSVSAFCNAGLSTFGDNLESYASSPVVLLTVAGLIVIGGIGFLVLVEVWEILRKKISRISLHSRIVLWMTLVLIAGGCAAFWIIESDNVLAGRGIGYSLLNSFFQSVTTRTAGFDSIAPGLYHKATAILMIILMFIGASPGGTGGGIKTTTFVIVLLFLGSMIHERRDVNIHERHIGTDTINKAITIFILSLFVILFSTVAILLVDSKFLMIDVLFEVTSAFGTVGLSRGITSHLGDLSQLVIVLTMVIGRIGSLTFLMAVLQRVQQQSRIRYPEGKVMIG